MLIIKATFPDGTTQNFGEPESLKNYMKDEGYTHAMVDTQYVFDTVCKMDMTIEEIIRWAAACKQ